MLRIRIRTILEKLYPDPRRSGKLAPDPDQSEKQDTDPDLHESEKVEALEGHFGALAGKSEW